MKKFIALLSILLISEITFSQTDSILFLGNSYTSANDLPGTFKSLAEAAGKSIFIDSYTPGAKQIADHYTDPTSLAKIAAHKWNYVVLQEQSQMPYINPNATKYYSSYLVGNEIKKNPCTEVVMYMTWARQEGEAWLVSTGLTHDQMAAKYEDFYTDFWQIIFGRVSPVGTAFHQATKQGINVYSGDGSHPNVDGTYLAACVFYATLYKESPIGLTFSSASTPTIKDQLQQIADGVVMNNFYLYNIDKIHWSMSNNDIKVGESINFTEGLYMEPYPTLNWTFEGGSPSTSSQENPAGIIYNSMGTFDVTLAISDACGYTESRTLKDTVKVQLDVKVEELEKNKLTVYPTVLNHFNQPFQIQGATENDLLKLKIYSLDGKELNFNLSNNQVTIQDFYNNIAVISLQDKIFKIVVE